MDIHARANHALGVWRGSLCRCRRGIAPTIRLVTLLGSVSRTMNAERVSAHDQKIPHERLLVLETTGKILQKRTECPGILSDWRSVWAVGAAHISMYAHQ